MMRTLHIPILSHTIRGYDEIVFLVDVFFTVNLWFVLLFNAFHWASVAQTLTVSSFRRESIPAFLHFTSKVAIGCWGVSKPCETTWWSEFCSTCLSGYMSHSIFAGLVKNQTNKGQQHPYCAWFFFDHFFFCTIWAPLMLVQFIKAILSV